LCIAQIFDMIAAKNRVQAVIARVRADFSGHAARRSVRTLPSSLSSSEGGGRERNDGRV
jgi:hypothetical protein